MRGYVDVGGNLVRWRGLTAAYTVAERSVMRSMPVREQAIVHTLKAFTQGEIADVETGHSALNQSANHGAVRPADEVAVGDTPLTQAGAGVMTESASSGLTFIDPEDIAFGKPAPKVVHNKREPFDVYIGRPSKWGNPFSHKPGTLAEFMVASRDEAIDAYADWIKTQPLLLSSLSELKNKTLGCWCAPQRCHGDVLLALANKPRRRPVYALVWTWRRHRVVKTKALGTRKMRAWKKWHERQGWKVISHGDGYFASKGPERHVISLHEYDRDTNERLK